MNERMRAASRAFLLGIKAERKTEEDVVLRSPALDLSDDAKRVFSKVASEPGTPIIRLYSDLGLNPTVGKRAIDEIVNAGFVRRWRLPRIGQGGPLTSLRITKEGYAELRRIGVPPAEKVLPRGGDMHEVYARWIAGYGKRQRYLVSFEQQFGGRFVDVVLKEKYGKTIGVEINISGSKKYNFEQAVSVLSVSEGIDMLWLCFDDRALLKAVAKEVNSLPVFFAAKVECKFIGEFNPWV